MTLQELNLSPADKNGNRNDSHSYLEKPRKAKAGAPKLNSCRSTESDLHVKLLFSQSPAYTLHTPPNFGHND